MQNKLDLFLSLLLTTLFSAGSTEQRIAMGTMSSWALGHILRRRLALPTSFRKAHNTYVFVSFWLLAAYNDPFYENTFGRVLDLFLVRDSCDPDVPGSGFTDWHETFRRRKAYGIELVWQFLRAMVGWTLVAVSLPIVIPVGYWLAVDINATSELERAFIYLHKHGELPPRPHRQPQALVSAGKDTRYNRLSDGLIFVCGPGGGYEKVINGDVEGASSLRRELRPRFA